MRKETKEETIQRIMKGLNCSRQEAENVFNYDYAIDHDEKTTFDLPPEKMKVAQTMTRTGTRRTGEGKKREKTPNTIKRTIIAEMINFLSQNNNFLIENVTILNEERQISFEIGQEKYEIMLTQKRKPK